jgi:pre-mRNA-processing factor 39
MFHAAMPAEFWCRYVRYLEGIGSVENAEGAVQRATLVYCKKRPEMHLFAAR